MSIKDYWSHIFLHERTQAAIAAGIAPENILLDPGFGGGSFGKTTKQNLQLLSRLGEFHDLKQPLVVGVSRKLFIGDVLQQAATERLYGSIAAAIIAAQASVSLLRVHDVKATADALRLLHAVLEEKN
jgi:dihydropteroate synthase